MIFCCFNTMFLIQWWKFHKSHKMRSKQDDEKRWIEPTTHDKTYKFWERWTFMKWRNVQICEEREARQFMSIKFMFRIVSHETFLCNVNVEDVVNCCCCSFFFVCSFFGEVIYIYKQKLCFVCVRFVFV